MSDELLQPIFPDSKYARWYSLIVEGARSRETSGYVEKHHVLPRSMGGTDEPLNLVDLTAREHFLVHWLLTKMVTGHALYKMRCAWSAFNWNKAKRQLTSAQYALIRENLSRVSSESQKGKPKSEATRKKISEALKNPSEEHRRKLSEAHMGNTQSLETRQKISKFQNGRPKSEATRQRMIASRTPEVRKRASEFHTGRPKSPETKLKMAAAAKKREETKRLRRMGISQ